VRVYGRLPATSLSPISFGGPGYAGGPGVAGGPTNPYTWVEVETDQNGFNDYVYITALIQCLKLNIGESPFWADWGIPGQQSVMTQVAPDYYVALMQQRYSQFFASLSVVKTATNPPTYRLNIITQSGVKLSYTIPT